MNSRLYDLLRLCAVTLLLFCGLASSTFAQNAEQPIFVDKVLIDPPSASFPVDTEINFRIGRLMQGEKQTYSAEILQLQTIDGKRNWTTVVPKHEFPIKPFKSRYVGASALHINIFDAKGRKQALWLGNFYFHKKHKPYPSLLRRLISDDFRVNALSDDFDRLAEELGFFAMIITDEPEFCAVEYCRIKKKWRSLDADFGDRDMSFSEKTKLVSFSDSGLLFNINDFKHYARLIKTLKRRKLVSKNLNTDADRQVVLSVLSTQLMYRGYMPGSPELGFLFDIHQPRAMCNTFSYQVMEILDRYDINSDFVSYENEFGGAHALVRVRIGENHMLLDPMQGRIYFGSIEDLRNGVAVETLDLPRYTESGIDLIADFPVARGIYVSDEIDSMRGQAFHKNYETVTTP